MNQLAVEGVGLGKKPFIVLILIGFTLVGPLPGRAGDSRTPDLTLSRDEVASIVLEGARYLIPVFRIALENGDVVQMDWILKAAFRDFAMVYGLGPDVDNLSISAAESLCALLSEEALLDAVRTKPAGSVTVDRVLAMKQAAISRVQASQQSYGGGSGCSVSSDDLFSD